MKPEDGALTTIIEKMDNINNILKSSSVSDDLYYDTIRCISYLKLAELREGFVDINNFLIQMGQLNFKHRLPINDNDSIINYIATALNFLCDELQQKILPKHDQIFNLLEEMIILTDKDGVISYCNACFARSFDLDADLLKGLKIFDFILQHHITLDLKSQGFHFKDILMDFKYNTHTVSTSMTIKEFPDSNSSELIFIGKKVK
jgi:PAS domain-containing protein